MDLLPRTRKYPSKLNEESKCEELSCEIIFRVPLRFPLQLVQIWLRAVRVVQLYDLFNDKWYLLTKKKKKKKGSADN